MTASASLGPRERLHSPVSSEKKVKSATNRGASKKTLLDKKKKVSLYLSLLAEQVQPVRSSKSRFLIINMLGTCKSCAAKVKWQLFHEYRPYLQKEVAHTSPGIILVLIIKTINFNT